MSNLLLLPILLNPCPLPAREYPAIISMYDPALGGINCDDDCTTVAMGKFDDYMYKVAGACPKELYGATVHFSYLGMELHCVDTGPAIEPTYFPQYGMCASYFDLLWPLHDEPAPDWAMWWWNNWNVAEWGGAWNWYHGGVK